MEEAESMPLPKLFNIEIKHLRLKRIFDIGFTLVVLTLGSPLFLLIALLVGLTSPGKIIYSHLRVGRGGVLFKCYKFRTMYKDADVRLKAILAACPNKRKEWKEKYKLQNDPRITPIGNFLRKTSLDELPQFWNVLKGDLSLVGPRPVVEEEIHQYFGEKAQKILSIRPGLTGLWQIYGRSDTSYETRIKLDEQYVDNQSLALDIKLILKTIPAMICKRGAY